VKIKFGRNSNSFVAEGRSSGDLFKKKDEQPVEQRNLLRADSDSHTTRTKRRHSLHGRTRFGLTNYKNTYSSRRANNLPGAKTARSKERVYSDKGNGQRLNDGVPASPRLSFRYTARWSCVSLSTTRTAPFSAWPLRTVRESTK